MSVVAKRLFFDIDGVGRVNAKPGSTFDPGGLKREAEVADTGVVGYGQEPVAPSAEFSIVNDGKVSVAQLRDLTDVNITIQDDNGVVWIMSGAWVSEPPKLSNGEISVSMMGISADPVS